MQFLDEYIFSDKNTLADLGKYEKPAIFKALSKLTGNFVAIKYFPPKVLETIEKKTVYRLIGTLPSLINTHVVCINKIFYNNQGGFIVMEWCDGTSVKNTLDRFKTLQEKLIGRYTVEILRGLQYLLKQGYTHQNLKASNLLLAGGVLKLSDFGLSAEVTNRKIEENPYHAAPEVLSSRTFSEASDVWSLGAVIIELLTGKPPYGDLSPEEARMKILSDEPMPIPGKATAHLRDFLMACFAKEPQNRPKLDQCLNNFFFVKNALSQMPQEEKTPQTSTLHIVSPPSQLSIKKPNQLPDLSKLDSSDENSVENAKDIQPKIAAGNQPPLQLAPAQPGKPLKIVDPVKTAPPPKPAKPTLDLFQDDDDDFADLKPTKGPEPMIQKVTSISPVSRGVLSEMDIDDGLSDEEVVPLSKTEKSPPERKKVMFNLPEPEPSSLKPEDKKEENTIQKLSSSMVATRSNNAIPGSSALGKFTEQDEDSDIGYNEDNGDSGGGLTIQPLSILPPPKKRNIDFTAFEEDIKKDEELFSEKIMEEDLKNNLMAELKRISADMNHDDLKSSFTTIFDIISKYPTVRTSIIELQGLMPVIEVLECGSRLPPDLVILVLKVIYAMLEHHFQLKESFCLLGGIPPVLKFLDKTKYSHEIRELSMMITNEICTDNSNEIIKHCSLLDDTNKIENIVKKNRKISADNIQMFISCGGTNSLVETLQYDFKEELDLVALTIQNISDILNSKCGIQIPDFCRLFMSAGLIEPLSKVLLEFVENKETKYPEAIHIICDTLYKLASADKKVRMEMADSKKPIITNIVACMYDKETGVVKRQLPDSEILILWKAIRLISEEFEARIHLQAGHVMEMGCAMVKIEFDQDNNTKSIHLNIVNMLQNMCKISKERLAIAAKSGLLSSLRRYLESDSDIRRYVMLMLLDFPNIASQIKDDMKQLINEGLIEIYISAIKQHYWGTRSMTSIARLVTDPDFNIIPILLKPENLTKIRDSVDIVAYEDAPTLLQAINTICTCSPEFTIQLADQSFANIMTSKLNSSLSLPADSQIPLATLNLMLTLFTMGTKLKPPVKPEHFITSPIKKALEEFCVKGNIKQKKTAAEILKFF